MGASPFSSADLSEKVDGAIDGQMAGQVLCKGVETPEDGLKSSRLSCLLIVATRKAADNLTTPGSFIVLSVAFVTLQLRIVVGMPMQLGNCHFGQGVF